MLTNVLLAAILFVLVGLLAAVKAGFNQVIAGLATVAANRVAPGRTDAPVA